ncbi:hypothetical protein O181_000830 [Austropuccinia psidii MF-1]|uniref:ABC transporter domain-containing protein n=1 Tax=Austropuccinia psidii MF-1 TaxID=1389203 RepID=A0A9Q3B9S7_9BASI|nr:hypothetical protein [Austropuccinia psidii MF-1]
MSPPNFSPLDRFLRIFFFGLCSQVAFHLSSASQTPFDLSSHPSSISSQASLPSVPKRPAGCPPCPECFNCQLPKFVCKQFGVCNEYDGQCKCPVGFGGQDCGQPVCGSLADGDKRHIRPDNSTNCSCSEGWTGVNCNVCQTDQACSGLLPKLDKLTGRLAYPDSSGISSDSSLFSNQSEAVCYKGGFAVQKNYQMCNVTNRKILDMLPDRPPQVSFSCDILKTSCEFQFWIGSIESFYCAFEDCHQSIQVGYQGQPNITQNQCNRMKCRCIPGKMLCGESGSVDISDFLQHEIKGPGKISCSSNRQSCTFQEPAMNQLITDIFGDNHITLDCQSGECMHYTMVPGFTVPTRPNNNQMVALSIALTFLFVVGASLLFWYCGRSKSHKYPVSGQRIRLPSDDRRSLTDHLPTHLTFSKISYSVNGSKSVLHQVSGNAQSGQLMAIMGASGAGKSSLLDILAKKTKSGFVQGDILINGIQISNNQFKSLIGYVDQEDTLLSTLTVYETVLCSAMLRLPREMSLEAKKIRTLETLEELGILHIKDTYIGKSGRRSISGGEKRRVSIGCELVTSPSILFLDEPTSGLDSFNAQNVVESLANLARNYKRTVIFTVHQPQSNIVTLFDQLVLLGSGGRLIYSGPFNQCHDYFAQIGHPCPNGYNIADFLVELTMKNQSKKVRKAPSASSIHSLLETPRKNGKTLISPHQSMDQAESLTSNTHQSSSSSRLPASSSQSLQVLSNDENVQDFAFLDHLAQSFSQSEIFKTLLQELEVQAHENGTNNLTEYFNARTQARVGLGGQFLVLSGRAFKNLYRNPMLMLSHYLLAIVLAVVCASLFHGVTLDIAGFQGRMGLFFFILALFGFSSLSTITTFSEERLLFMRERANNYYNPTSYFISKLLFDLIPLRIVPPFILGAIIYYPVGLVATLEQFWKFLLVLISFNLVSSSLVMLVSLVMADIGVANLIGSLIMLFNLLFAGLLVNREKLPYGTAWLQDISFFHSAFEALLINEVRYLTLKDHRYGVDIEVPSASILSLFGFRITAFWWPDFSNLAVMFILFTSMSYLSLIVLVKERR